MIIGPGSYSGDSENLDIFKHTEAPGNICNTSECHVSEARRPTLAAAGSARAKVSKDQAMALGFRTERNGAFWSSFELGNPLIP